MERIRDKLWLVILIALLFGGISHSGHAQGFDKYYALLTYKLTDYFLWPDNPEVKTIGVFGNSKVTMELDNIVSSKKETKIKIVKITSLSEIGNCNIVFLPLDQSNKFPQLLEQLGNSKIVFVTEAEGYAAQGAGISFYMRDKRIKMRLNRSAIEAKDIKISSSLLAVVETI